MCPRSWVKMATLSDSEIAMLKAQRDKLKKAMRSGALSVQHGDKRVQYRSMAEMQTALDGLNDELSEAVGRKRKRVFYLGGTRGF